jgi:peptide/nickel transport system permease protein
MAGYLIRRFISGIFAFWIFTAILFFGINLLIPSDYVVTLSLSLEGNAAREALREELGLNLPLTQQYINWLGQLVRGNLGQEFTIEGRGYDVTHLIGGALPSTLLIFLTGGFLAFMIGQWLGQVTAWKMPRWASGSLLLGAIASYTAFPPWLAFLIGFLLVDYLGLLPSRYQNGNLDGNVWRGAPYTVPEVLIRMLVVVLVMFALLVIVNKLAQHFMKQGLPLGINILLFFVGNVLLWRAGGFGVYAVDIAKLAAIPILVFTLLSFGDTMLITRASIQDVKLEMYIQTARAKGVPEKDIRRKHAGRNAILPVLSQFVISIPYLMTAIVIVERATGWSGIGDMLFNAVSDQNTYVYMGILVIVGLVSLIARLFLDVAYAVMDPRIRFSTYERGGAI